MANGMEELRQMARQADENAVQARRFAREAAQRAGELHAICGELRLELNRIANKRMLKLKLTKRESAIWTLYGER